MQWRFLLLVLFDVLFIALLVTFSVSGCKYFSFLSSGCPALCSAKLYCSLDTSEICSEPLSRFILMFTPLVLLLSHLGHDCFLLKHIQLLRSVFYTADIFLFLGLA